jgi:replicative DNA helicase
VTTAHLTPVPDPEPADQPPAPSEPQNILAEQCALGAMLHSPEAIAEVSAILRPDGSDFYPERHRKIYRAILHAYNEGSHPDAVTIAGDLIRSGDIDRVGGITYLHDLVQIVPTVANARRYAEEVLDAALKYRAYRLAVSTAEDALHGRGTGRDVVARLESAVTGLAPAEDREEFRTAAEAWEEAVAEVESIANHAGKSWGAPTGLVDLDDLTNGLHGGQMAIIAARPAVGKSTLGLGIAQHAAKHGVPSVFFSLEMKRTEIMQRLISAEGRVMLHHMRSGNMTEDDWDRIAAVMPKVTAMPLWLDTTPQITMTEIRAKCRRLKQRENLGLVVVDYLQLMSGGRTDGNRQQEVSEFSRSMKLLAKELDVPVVVLSQLNRGPEARTDKQPMMSDLRESGSLEQDADLIMLLHRPDLYDKESPRAGEADIIVAKHRNGPTATISVSFQGHYSRFVDMAQVYS